MPDLSPAKSEQAALAAFQIEHWRTLKDERSPEFTHAIIMCVLLAVLAITMPADTDPKHVLLPWAVWQVSSLVMKYLADRHATRGFNNAVNNFKQLVDNGTQKD